MTHDDSDLREAFRAARAAERASATPFRRVLEGRAGRPRKLSRVPGLLLVGGALAVAGVVLFGRPEAPVSELDLARQVMAWRSHTDFLLPANAAGLLSFVPRIGEAPAGSPLQALDPGGILGPPVLPRSPRS